MKFIRVMDEEDNVNLIPESAIELICCFQKRKSTDWCVRVVTGSNDYDELFETEDDAMQHFNQLERQLNG